MEPGSADVSTMGPTKHGRHASQKDLQALAMRSAKHGVSEFRTAEWYCRAQMHGRNPGKEARNAPCWMREKLFRVQ